jgi:hypothetical protein
MSIGCQELMQFWKHILAQKLDFAFSRLNFVCKVVEVVENRDFKI